MSRASLVLLLAAFGCGPEGHGPIGEGVTGKMGDPVGFATPEQLAAFERGHEVIQKRFTRAEGLGPAFNLTFCGGCHEKPVFGGAAGEYRNFWIARTRFDDGVMVPAESFGAAGGVQRLYYYPPLDLDAVQAELDADETLEDVVPSDSPRRPVVLDSANAIAKRNPIPFFGVGLLASVSEEEILEWSDPDDADGDGISGRPNYIEGVVGRFGVKAQTNSIEGFIRGPVFNHMGVTSNPLTEAQRAALPVDSSRAGAGLDAQSRRADPAWAGQVGANDSPLTDKDGVPDPEMSGEMLFDLVSFSMLLAAPEPEPETERTARGRELFDQVQCVSCHRPRLESNWGPIPIYSDILLHDMGEAMSDNLPFEEATASEFRTQPLWGVAATAPYLHDGRAMSLEEAIWWHGGEAKGSRDAFFDLALEDQELVVEFLLSLGGRDQYSPGLVPLDEPVPEVGEWAGPLAGLDEEQAARFKAGRTLFDKEFGQHEGVGGPRFNGDSCRACHFEPTIGGAGPRDVNVIRHGILNGNGGYTQPSVGNILHRTSSLDDTVNRPQSDTDIFELRQTPHLFGLGLIDAIPEANILANADEFDRDGDGISGKPSYVDGGTFARFGWKADVPSIDEFVRDAVTMELGMTLPYEDGLTFGKIQDNDDIPDPEYALEDAHLLADWLRSLGAPPRTPADEPAKAEQGEQVFADVGCTSCHIPALDGADGPVPLYSDLLLHEILPSDAVGIESGSATMREFRTAPLWGIAQTAPYLHDGSADTLHEAIEGHAGEASDVVSAYGALPEAEREALLAFLRTL